jgi:RIO kinase 1
LSGYDEKLEARIARELFQSEKDNRYLRKRSEEYQALESVFDRETLFALYELMKRGSFDYLNGVVRAGKEGRVYWGVKGVEDVAVKVFYTTASSYRKRLPYMAGDPRFKRVKKYGKALIMEWTRKEFSNLSQAYMAGVSVPRPHSFRRNVIVMEFIGREGSPAETLAETEVTKRDYASVVSNVGRLYSKAKLVHADLSEYNVFKFDGRVYLFDFGSAVDVRHPMALAFLRRDLGNINRFFMRRGIEVRPVEELLKRWRAE